MQPTGWRLLAAVSAVAAALGVTTAATRPRYGGTLRLEIRERLATLDPAEKSSGVAARIEAFVFDRLVRIDDEGRPQPALAISWQSDSEQKRWEFRLRPGVQFQDGYPLTAATVGGVLQRLLGSQGNIAVAADSVVVKLDRPTPGLLAELARPSASVAARSHEGALVGTGPFRVAHFDAGRHLSLAAFEGHWGGRPFVDTLEIEMGRTTREQFVDLQVGKADVIELAPNELRNAVERGTKTWVSAPVELLALVFGPGRASDDARLREALALSIDRAAIHNVLLQRQGIVTGALLPQWLSGYAFLFPTAMNLARARQLAAEVPAAERTLPLAYDPADPQARILAERLAVNARDAGITLQVTNQPKSELRLVRTHFSSLDAAVALTELSAALALGDPGVPAGERRPEALYTAERTLLEGFRVVPLFHLPDAYGVNAKVKTWQRPGVGRLGWLNLADIYLEPAP